MNFTQIDGPIVQRSRNSPIHRSGNLLCGDLNGGTESVNRNSLGTSHCSQLLEPSGPGRRTSFPTTSTFMTPTLAAEKNLQNFHSVILMHSGYYAELLPTCTQNQPQSSGHCHVADSSFAAHVYDPLTYTYQSPGTSMDFGGMFSESITAYQPPIPPAPPPEEFIPLNPAFYYHPCRWLSGPPCDNQAPGKNREMGEHLRTFHHFVGHERDPVQCNWEGCNQVMQRMNVPRHIVSRHLLAAANCRFCRRRFSRPDVVARHERTCDAALSASSGSTTRI